MRTLWGVVLLILTNVSAMSQSFPVLPVRFCQYANAYHRINPSIVNYNHRASLYSGIQTNNIAFNTIYTYYTNFQFVFDNTSSVNQAIGLNFTGDHEGDLLRRTGVYLLYAVEIPLTENLWLGSGISVGVKNFLIKPTPVNGGGSDMQPDGRIGINIRNDRWHLGVSIDQMFNGELQPIEEGSRLVRHFNVTADRTFEVSPFFKIRPGVWVRWYDSDMRDINGSVEFVLNDRVQGGIIANYNKETAFTFGLNNIDIRQGSLDLSLSYAIATGKNYLSTKQNYELTFQYHFKQKERQ